jgi:hypothetical protein
MSMFKKLRNAAKAAHQQEPTNIEVSKRYWDSFGATKTGGNIILAFRSAALHSTEGVVALVDAFQELMHNSGEPPRPKSFDPELRSAINQAMSVVDESERTKLTWLLTYIDQ